MNCRQIVALGKLDAIKEIYENPLKNDLLDDTSVKLAAFGNYLDCLIFLCERVKFNLYDAMQFAIDNDSLECLEYLHKNYYSCAEDIHSKGNFALHYLACDQAIMHSNLRCLDYLKKNNFKYDCICR